MNIFDLYNFFKHVHIIKKNLKVFVLKNEIVNLNCWPEYLLRLAGAPKKMEFIKVEQISQIA